MTQPLPPDGPDPRARDRLGMDYPVEFDRLPDASGDEPADTTDPEQ